MDDFDKKKIWLHNNYNNNNLNFQSAEVLESVKRDLGELTTIVTTETSNIVLNTTNVVKETLQVCHLLTFYCFNKKQLFISTH